MKKITCVGLFAGALLGLSVSAQAGSFNYTDIISYYGPGEALVDATGAVKSVSGTFDITSSPSRTLDTVTIVPGYSDQGVTYQDKFGFDTSKEVAVDGFVSFYFRDNKDNVIECANIKLDGGVVYDNGNLELINKNVTFNQIGANANILATINADGKLDFKVTATTGNFYFDYARLDINTAPDGATTVMLLGGSLCGIGMLRRKLKV